MRWEAGDNETEFLAVEGLKYLKQLDGSQTGQACSAGGPKIETIVGKNRKLAAGAACGPFRLRASAPVTQRRDQHGKGRG